MPKINLDATYKNDTTDHEAKMITSASLAVAMLPNQEFVDSVYESCNTSVADEAEAPNHSMHTAALPTSCADQTPKMTGILIKTGSFAERQAAPTPSFYAAEESDAYGDAESMASNGASADDPCPTVVEDDEPAEQWFTPCGKLPRSISRIIDADSQRAATVEINHNEHSDSNSASCNDSDSDENVFYGNEKPSGSGLWSIVTSVMRLASFGSEPPKPGASLLKRCATYAGRITSFDSQDGAGSATSFEEPQTPSNKRRRTKTSGGYTDLSPTNPANRAKRIIGRPPLKRMRRVPS